MMSNLKSTANVITQIDISYRKLNLSHKLDESGRIIYKTLTVTSNLHPY